jgi:DNA-binding NarL/FixJ family response regulator
MDTARVTVALGPFEDLLACGLRTIVAGDPGLELIGQPTPPRELRALLAALEPRVAVIDHRNLANAREVRELVGSHPHTRLVLFADGLSGAECAQLLTFGASACLSRATQSRDVLNAIHLAARGLQVTPRELNSPAAANALTEREVEVLAELQQRRANAQIASDLHISVETVRTHARNIYRKLGVSSRRELQAAARQAHGSGAG